MTSEKLKKLYYSDKGYLIGKNAVEKLTTLSQLPKEDVERWLSKQSIFQVYFPTVKIIRPHFNIKVPNEAHQADLLFLPTDAGYKYALTVIDLASRYKEARPLKSKKSEHVAEALKDIYKKSPLKYPKTLMTDPGKEFMGAVKKMMGERIRYGRTDLHRDQAFVERFNSTLAKRIFAKQTAEELKLSSGKYYTKWIDRLPAIIEVLNNEVSRMTGLKPVDAIHKSSIPLPPTVKSLNYPKLPGIYSPEILTPKYFVRYQYLPGELEKDTKRRATDPTFSLDVHRIERHFTTESGDYYFLDPMFNPSAPSRSFVRAELLVIPDDTEIK